MLIEFIKTDFEFADDRGSLTQLVHSGWQQVNYITSVAKAFRGNHYHKYNSEAFYVIRGSFRLKLEKIDHQESEEHTIHGGDFFIIRPCINHSFEFLEDTALISLYDQGVENADGTKDIWNQSV